MPVQKLRFKTAAGADVTDSVRQALSQIVRMALTASEQLTRPDSATRFTQVPELDTLLAQTEVRAPAPAHRTTRNALSGDRCAGVLLRFLRRS